ncbi:hypothetical protein BH762_gp006 [Gordonia phage OneUp]|uniref:Lipoprotein n=1 Tax=Gordonia phage OneUp TaxID=1838074 RepID=A0A160DER6_9CAUD|nr:hypothetical protein BH762_gp006 [Gordonia phage OneUp]ANA86349.1 hypothetical protein PBI_ONEUP_6 [Gordonia phage OneUp]
MNKTKKIAAALALAGVLGLTGCGDTVYSGEVIEKKDRIWMGKYYHYNNLHLRDCGFRNSQGQCRTDWIQVDDRTYASTKVGDWHQDSEGKR